MKLEDGNMRRLAHERRLQEQERHENHWFSDEVYFLSDVEVCLSQAGIKHRRVTDNESGGAMEYVKVSRWDYPLARYLVETNVETAHEIVEARENQK